MKKRIRVLVKVSVVLAAILVFNGCLSSKITKSRKDFYHGNYSAAADRLAGVEDKKGRNQILILLEYGLALHTAGIFQQSINALIEADKLIEKNEVFHIAEETGSMVTNDMITTFRPESFERVLVHTYLAINFMLTDDWSAARVEAKRALEVLDALDPDLQSQPFTRYVCGLAYEVMGDSSDAYIEYKKVVEEAPDFLPLYYQLYRLAMMGGRQEAEKWAREIKSHGGNAAGAIKSPNLIVFVGAGRSPIKREINMVVPPNAMRFVVPEYVSSGSYAHHAILRIDNEYSTQSFVLTDLNPLAKKTLKKRIAKEIAKEIARVAAKEAIVRGVEEQNVWAGLALRIFFFASEAADTRSWESLPRYMGVITQYIDPGDYNISVEFFTMEGSSLGVVENKKVNITEGRRTVLSVRSVQ